jgi:precorrin-8X/cobalt-precorrin-8 methylmutase
MVTWPSEASGAAAAEEESYRIIRSRIDLSRLPKYSRDVTERVIYASADFDYATDLVCDEEALAAGVAALAAGAPVIVDADMVAAGITGCPVISKLGEPLTQRLARTATIPAPAAAVRLAFGEAGPGAVWVVGCAPEALMEILTREVEPAFVIGLPAGFVGAAEAKDALRASGLRSVSNVSEKGGAAVAAAAFSALLRSAPTAGGSRAGAP